MKRVIAIVAAALVVGVAVGLAGVQLTTTDTESTNTTVENLDEIEQPLSSDLGILSNVIADSNREAADELASEIRSQTISDNTELLAVEYRETTEDPELIVFAQTIQTYVGHDYSVLVRADNGRVIGEAQGRLDGSPAVINSPNVCDQDRLQISIRHPDTGLIHDTELVDVSEIQGCR